MPEIILIDPIKKVAIEALKAALIGKELRVYTTTWRKVYGVNIAMHNGRMMVRIDHHRIWSSLSGHWFTQTYYDLDDKIEVRDVR